MLGRSDETFITIDLVITERTPALKPGFSRSVSALSTLVKGNLSRSYLNNLFEHRKMKAGVGQSATERAIYKILLVTSLGRLRL